jgi:hypothetical protein
LAACFHRGSEDDPDFNNVRLEIVWPGSEQSGSNGGAQKQ